MQSWQNSDSAHRLRSSLAFARRRLSILLGWETALWAIIISLGGAVVLTLLEKGLYLPAGWRVAILWLAALLIFIAVAFRLWRLAARYGSLERVARALDSAKGGLYNRFETSLEFIRAGELPQGQSRQLVQAAIDQAASLLSSKDEVLALSGKVVTGDRRRIRLAEFAALGLLGLIMAFAAADPLGFQETYRNYRHPLELLARERSFHIVVQPGNAVLLRGDSLLVRAVGSIHRPGQMTLNFWQAGEARQSLVMQYRPGQFEYTCTFSGLQNDIRYFVQQAGTATDTFLVQVTNNPFVTELSITYQYPPYTGLADFTTTRDKAIQGLRGTRMILDGHSSNTLAHASLVLSPDSLRPLPLIGGRSFTDTLVLAHDGSYGIRLTDTWGLTNDDTLHYPITVVPDEPPAVALRFPGQNAQIDEAMKQPLVFELADDYGVLKLEIEYAKMASDGRRGETRRKRIALWSGENRTHFIDQYLWELSDLNLLPEDEVAYKLIVYDNDRVSGPKATASDEFRVRFPSLEEIFTREQQRQDDITTSLETLEERGEKFRQQVKELNEAIERGKNLEWEQNQQLDQTLTDQKKMLDQVKNIADQLQQSIDQMQRGQMMTVEMMEKMARVQSLLEEVANDRVKQLMTQLQQSIDKLDRRAVADALRQLQISQEQILQKLDKTLALLENLKLEQQMDYLVQKSEEIAQAARQLADTSAALLGEKPSPADSSASDTRDASGSESQKQKSQEYSDSTRNQERSRQAESPVENRQFPQGEMKSGQPNSRSQQAEQGRPGQPENIGEDKQRELGEKAGEIGEQTEDLFERLAETAKGMQKAQEEELAQKLQQEGSPENRQFFSNSLNRIGNNLMSGRLRQSLSQEQEFAGGMQKMNQRLEQYRDELTEKWQKKVAEAMKRAFDELGYLSESQEEIMLAVDAEPDFTHPDILRYAAREQEVVAGLESVLTGVTEAAKDNFFISAKLLFILMTAVNNGQQSVEKLEAEIRQKPQTVGSLKNSLVTINAGMLSLLEDSENMQQSTSAMGADQLMQQLEAVAQRQQELNQMTQDAASGMQSGQNEGLPMPGSMGNGQNQSQGNLLDLLRQMAAEQEAIRQQIDELAKQMAGRKEMFGSGLEGAEQDAKEAAKDLQQSQINPQTLERQRRIIQRLLDAQKSMQEREEGRQRKAEQPRDFTVVPPEALDSELLKTPDEEDAFRRALERWQGSYPDSYDILIREYYELLRAKNVGN